MISPSENLCDLRQGFKAKTAIIAFAIASRTPFNGHPGCKRDGRQLFGDPAKIHKWKIYLTGPLIL